MIVDKDVVLNIAELAQLEILPGEIQEYVVSLGNVLNLVDQMSSVDTEGVEPMAHPLDGVQRLRLDEVRESDQSRLFQEIAPEVSNGLYLVPKVIE